MEFLPAAHARPRRGATDSSEGLLARIWPKLNEWQQQGAEQTRTAGALGITAGDELHCVARWYSRTDRDAAARLDGMLDFADAQRVPRDEISDPGDAKSFNDDPVHYNGPDPNKVNDPSWWPVRAEQKANEILGLGGTLGALAGILKELTGSNKDIFQLAAEAVVGDWKALQEQAVLFSDTADGFERIAANVNLGRFGIQGEWSGEAADQARNWLAKYHSGCLELSAYCRAAGQAIEGLAESAYHLMGTLRHGLGAVVDILLLLYARGVIVTSKVGRRVVDIILEVIDWIIKGKSLLDISRGDALALAHLVLSLIEEVGQVQTVIDAILALAHGFALQLGLEKAIGATLASGDAPGSWPDEMYEHPQAGCPPHDIDDDDRKRVVA